MRRFLPAGLLLSLTFLTCASAADSSALINDALDKGVKLQVDGVLPLVLKTIEDQTGVPIKVDPAVYDLLPWGDQTTVSARIENQTLRQALTAITRKLGLTFDLGPQAVEVVAMPGLARLGKRSTVQELSALDLLSSASLDLSVDRLTVRQLVDAIDQKLVALKSPYAVEFRPGDSQDKGAIKQDSTVDVPRNSTLADALESLTKDTDATWYPWGRNIIIIPKQAWVRVQLNKTMTAQFNRVPVEQVLNDLSKRIGVEFKVEPGAVQRVPNDFRLIQLVLDNVPVRQVLDSISGVTGLNYVVSSEGVYIYNQNPNPAAAAGAGGDHIVIMLPLDNGMQLVVRERDLPEDLRQYAADQKGLAIKHLQERMRQEQGKSATQPATKPAGKHDDL